MLGDVAKCTGKILLLTQISVKYRECICKISLQEVLKNQTKISYLQSTNKNNQTWITQLLFEKEIRIKLPADILISIRNRTIVKRYSRKHIHIFELNKLAGKKISFHINS